MIFNNQDRECRVTLSEAKGLAMGTEMLRSAQHDSQACHPECSEGSLAMGTEMLRSAQHDSQACHPECSEGSRDGHRDASLRSA